MKWMTALSAAVFGLSLLACGGTAGVSSDPFDYITAVPNCSPWEKMGLPVDDGKIQTCSSDIFTVIYKGSVVSEKFDAFYGKITSSGFSQFQDASDGGTKTVIYRKGDKQQVTLAVIEAAGLTTVSMSKMDL